MLPHHLRYDAEQLHKKHLLGRDTEVMEQLPQKCPRLAFFMKVLYMPCTSIDEYFIFLSISDGELDWVR